MRDLKAKIQSLNSTEKLILMSIFLLFINIFVQGIFIIGILIYAFRKKEWIQDIKNTPGYKILYPFFLLELFVSCFYKNLYGIGISIGLILVFMYIAFVRNHLNYKLFQIIIEIMILMSFFINLIGLFQFYRISILNGYSFFDFHIFNSPKRRISSTFLNANYYAMILEFLIVCCMVRFVQCKKGLEKIKYVGIGVFDLVLMYLTGCRAAFLPFVVMVPAFLFLSKEKKWGWASIASILALSCILFLKPDLIPRLSDVSTVGSRFKIWTCAFQSIKDHTLFGMGPFSYSIANKIYNGHPAPHCHNIYIDMLCSYGIVGTICIITACVSILKDIVKIRKWNEHPEYFAMIVAFILIVLIHGIMDCTLLNICTGVFILLILNCSVCKINKV